MPCPGRWNVDDRPVQVFCLLRQPPRPSGMPLARFFFFCYFFAPLTTDGRASSRHTTLNIHLEPDHKPLRRGFLFHTFEARSRPEKHTYVPMRRSFNSAGKNPETKSPSVKTRAHATAKNYRPTIR